MQGGLTLGTAITVPTAPTAIENAGRYFPCDAVPTGAVACGNAVFAGFGDGMVRIFRPDLPMQEVAAHRGSVLCFCIARHGTGGLAGGDDGRLVQMSDAGVVREFAAHPMRWVDCVAAGANGNRAASVGKTEHVRETDGRTHALDHPSTVGGHSFDRKGDRPAVAHYGGATVWSRERRGGKPLSLKWAGSHVGVTWSPDGRFVVTTMQENALRGWRLRDRADMRMSGYPARVKSMARAGRLPHLATSGAQEAICWPFDGANGPMGRRPPMLCLDGEALVTAVTGLPGHDAILTGFENGVVLFSALDPMAKARVVKRHARCAITHLVVTADTGWMLVAAEDGLMLWAPLGREPR